MPIQLSSYLNNIRAQGAAVRSFVQANRSEWGRIYAGDRVVPSALAAVLQWLDELDPKLASIPTVLNQYRDCVVADDALDDVESVIGAAMTNARRLYPFIEAMYNQYGKLQNARQSIVQLRSVIRKVGIELFRQEGKSTKTAVSDTAQAVRLISVALATLRAYANQQTDTMVRGELGRINAQLADAASGIESLIHDPDTLRRIRMPSGMRAIERARATIYKMAGDADDMKLDGVVSQLDAAYGYFNRAILAVLAGRKSIKYFPPTSFDMQRRRFTNADASRWVREMSGQPESVLRRLQTQAQGKINSLHASASPADMMAGANTPHSIEMSNWQLLDTAIMHALAGKLKSTKAPSQTEDQFRVKVVLQKYLATLLSARSQVQTIGQVFSNTSNDINITEAVRFLTSAIAACQMAFRLANMPGEPDRRAILKYWNEAYGEKMRARSAIDSIGTVNAQPKYTRAAEQLRQIMSFPPSARNWVTAFSSAMP